MGIGLQSRCNQDLPKVWKGGEVTEDEIKRNAPDGATHYHKTKYGAIYLKKVRYFLFLTKWAGYSDSLDIWSGCYISDLLNIKPL